MADEAESGQFDVRAARRRLGNIMKKVDALLLELRKLEGEIPVPPLREYEAMKARGGQSQSSTEEAMRKMLIELAEEGAESFPELAELIVCMVGKLVELGPDRQGVVNFVMAAVSKAYAGNLETCGRFLLQVALILTGLCENEAIGALREITSTAALSIVTGKSN
jgi:hypothetical protein